MNLGDSYTLIAKADYGEGFVVILYKTNQDQYFSTVRTVWGRTEKIRTLNRSQAIEDYNRLPIHLVSFEDAFPMVEV